MPKLSPSRDESELVQEGKRQEVMGTAKSKGSKGAVQNSRREVDINIRSIHVSGSSNASNLA